MRLTAREVLDHRGKGDKKPPPTVRLRHGEQAGAKVWTLHMPVLKALHATDVHTMQQRQAAYALLRELQGTDASGQGAGLGGRREEGANEAAGSQTLMNGCS